MSPSYHPAPTNRAIIASLITPHLLPAAQLLSALIIAILYGIDLHHASSTDAHAPAEWIYAEIIAALSGSTCILRWIKPVRRDAWHSIIWDFVMIVLWAAQAGTFGMVFLSAPDGDGDGDDVDRGFTTSVGRMRAGVAVGLVSMVLWSLSFGMGVVGCCRVRREKKSAKKRGREAEMRAKTLEDIEVGRMDDCDYESGGGTGAETGGVEMSTARDHVMDGANRTDGDEEWRSEKQRQRDAVRGGREMEKASEEDLVGSLSILAARR